VPNRTQLWEWVVPGASRGRLRHARAIEGEEYTVASQSVGTFQQTDSAALGVAVGAALGTWCGERAAACSRQWAAGTVSRPAGRVSVSGSACAAEKSGASPGSAASSIPRPEQSQEPPALPDAPGPSRARAFSTRSGSQRIRVRALPCRSGWCDHADMHACILGPQTPVCSVLVCVWAVGEKPTDGGGACACRQEV
jgi:hypothetical protein